MEHRSPKLQGKEKKIQTSCIWGLVDIFDFRNGRSNQKLLTNGRRVVHKEVSDFEHSRKVHTIASCHGKREGFKEGEGLVMHAAAAATNAFEESVKNLMKQKFGNTKKSKKQKKASKKQLMNLDVQLVNQLQGYEKKPRKPSMESDQVHIQQRKDKFLLGPDLSPGSTELSLGKHKLQAMCEEICSQVYREEISGEDTERVSIPSKYNEPDQINMQLLQIAAKAFIDQIYIDRKHKHTDGESCKSKYFSDALDILNLNTDLFLQLLQDSNSLLLKGIRNSQFPLRDKERMKFYLDSNPTECKCDVTRSDQDPVNSINIQKRNSNNPLWKKLKYRYGCSSRENTTSRDSNMIVILKPVPTRQKYPEDVSCHCSSRQAHKSLKNKEQIIKSTYLFKDIKRKFKQAVGDSQQKQQRISMDESLRRLARNKRLPKDADKGKSSGSVEGKSAFSPDAKRKEKQLVDLTSSNRSKTALSGGNSCESSSSDSCSKQRQIDIFLEAKRHLSARLRNIERGEIVPRKEAPQTLKMILSSPEDDLLTIPSPKRDKNTSTSVQMRDSPYNTHLISTNSFENEEGKGRDFPCTLQYVQEAFSHDLTRLDELLETSESTPEISQRPQAEAEVPENIYSTKDDLGPSGSANLKANEVVTQKSSNILELPYDLNSIDDAKDRLGTETMKNYEENGYMESSDLTIPLENHSHGPLFGSSRSLNIHELEIVKTAKYKEEHTSPVSVLEPFSPEDVNSPTSIMSKPDESSLQPRRIAFDDCSQVMSQEDPKINTNVCIDMEEPLHVYVREIIEASELGFNFNNEIYLKGPSQQDILYTCIAEIMGLYSFESYNELQLLFDCIHEVLLRIYESYFGYPPWLSFLRQKIRPIPQEKEVVDEVVKEVNLYLLPKAAQPTLDQLVAEDILKSGSWLDLFLDTEDILIQIAEDVLQDSIEDAVLEVQI